MYRLEYNQKQDAYHVSMISEPLLKGWEVILDRSTREEIDVFYKNVTTKKMEKSKIAA